MALIHTSSSSTPPTQPMHYHVFLSFRGKDTRTNFTDHLYSALLRKGIVTFRDDEELEGGEVISERLLKAIEQSLFSVVVLSQNYASSSWCLDELQKIMESKQKLGQTVIPIFYGVDPSDIRYQKKENVAEAFQKHETRFSDDKVQGWRKALNDVAGLSGWHVKDDQHEAKIVEDIAKFVWRKLCDELPSNFEHLVGGIQSKVDTIISRLKIGLDEKCFMGIWGMGGIGKTILARVVYNTIRQKFKFDASCFLADVRTESKQVGFVSLQKKLLSSLGLGELPIYNHYDGEEAVRTFLCHKKVLIVLDDVNDSSQLDNLARNNEWFGVGSKIIITTRDVQLLRRYEQFEEYEVRGLCLDESLKLLCQKAFKKDKPKEGYLELSKKVVEYACGLPLALEVLGSFLHKRKQCEWGEALDKWSKNLYKGIFSPLCISYDGLEEKDYKEIFLDIACFFNGVKRSNVTNILKICGHYPTIGINVLIEKSLLSSPQSNSNLEQNAEEGLAMHDRLQKMRRDIFLPTFMYHKLLDEASQESLHMHDLLQEMGRNIVFEESPNDVGSRSRLWSLEDIDLVLKQKRGTNKIQSIVLESIATDLRHHFEANWPSDCFSKMENLRLLDLSRVHLSRNLNFLPRGLKFLRWDHYALESLPPIDQSYELESLQLCSSKIKKPWDGTLSLDKLRIIDLSNSDDLEATPNFNGTPNLEKLLLNYCGNLVRVHESVGQLKKLVELSLRYCTQLVTLPTYLDMNNLEVFILGECSKLEKLPEFGKSMRKLYFLDVRGTKITEIPSSIIHLINLKYLDLSSWHILKSIAYLAPNLFIRASSYPFLESTSDLQCLIESCVSKGPIHLFFDSKRFDLLGGERIPRWFKRHEHRHSKDNSGEVVTITADLPCDVVDYEGENWAIVVCIVFECLSEAWRGFSINWEFQDYFHPNNKSHRTDPKISRNVVFETRHSIGYVIDEEDCQQYPSDVGSQVESKLDFPTANAIPFGKNIHDYTHVEIDSRVYTGFFPIDKESCRRHPSGVGSQIDLTLRFPKSNVTVGGKKRHFKNLEVADCGWQLVCNKDLDASSSDFEGGCCINSEQLYELESLQLFSSEIKELWNGAPFLDKLKIIDLNGGDNLIETPDFSGTPNLEKLILMYCPKLVRVHESVGQLKKLVKLSLEYCGNLVTLPSYLEMDNLEEFIIFGCVHLEKVPEFGENMRNLHFLDLTSANSITEIPSSIIHLINLKYLHLTYCGKLTSIPKLPQNLIINTSNCDLLEPASVVSHFFASHGSEGPIHLLYDFFTDYSPWNKGISRYYERREHRRSKDSSGEVVTITPNIPCDVVGDYEGECWAIAVCIVFQGASKGWRDFCINWKFQDYCHSNSNNNKSHTTRFRYGWRIYVGFYPIDKEQYCQPHPSGIGSQIDLTLSFPTAEIDSMGRRYENSEIVECGWRLVSKKDFANAGSASFTDEFDAERSIPSSISSPAIPDTGSMEIKGCGRSPVDKEDFDGDTSIPSSISLPALPEEPPRTQGRPRKTRKRILSKWGKCMACACESTHPAKTKTIKEILHSRCFCKPKQRNFRT